MTICRSCMPYLATWHQIQITIQFFSYPSDYVYVTGYIIYLLLSWKFAVCWLLYYLGESKTRWGPDSNKPCHFPFTYQGKLWDKCTEADSPGRPWCATTPVFSHETYGYCDCGFGMCLTSSI